MPNNNNDEHHNKAKTISLTLKNFWNIFCECFSPVNGVFFNIGHDIWDLKQFTNNHKIDFCPLDDNYDYSQGNCFEFKNDNYVQNNSSNGNEPEVRVNFDLTQPGTSSTLTAAEWEQSSHQQQPKKATLHF